MGKYNIVGRQVNGTNTVGYLVVDVATNRRGVLPRDMVYKLAIDKQINDVIAQVYNGKVVMKGVKQKITELPRYDMAGNRIESPSAMEALRYMKLSGKVMSGKAVVGYQVCLFEGNKILKKCILPRPKVINLVKQGSIANARYQSSNGKGLIRGVGCNLAQLPVISES